jgi:hypothetical protein
MTATMEAQELQDEQENDSEVKDQLDEGNTSLKLQKVCTDATTSICGDISTGYVRSYVPASLRQKVFTIIHNPTHPSGKATCQQLEQKYSWPHMWKDICLGVASVSPANVLSFDHTTETLRRKSTFRINASVKST